VLKACLANGISVVFADERSRPWTQEELDELIKLAKAGTHYRDIAVALRRGINTVKTRLRELGLSSMFAKKLEFSRRLAESGKRQCSCCKEEKPFSEFGKHSKFCKDCQPEMNRRISSRLANNTDVAHILRKRLATARDRSKAKCMPMDIDMEHLKMLYERQQGRCFYTKDVLSLKSGTQLTLSLDRKDSSLGYIKGNVVLCTKQANMMKLDSSIEELTALIRRMYACLPLE
jgi:hypothetical protein